MVCAEELALDFQIEFGTPDNETKAPRTLVLSAEIFRVLCVAHSHIRVALYSFDI